MPAGTFPNGLNTLIPLHEASGHLQVKYSRNPKSFKLNKYTVQVAAPLARGAYLEFNANDGVRLRSKSKWPYGTPARVSFDNQVGFEQKNFFCERYNFDTALDQFAVDMASFDVQKIHSEKLARLAMINRTEVALTSITNVANYPSDHTATATDLAGGFLDGGTTSDARLFKALTEASIVIQRSTAGVGGIPGAQFGILMSPKTALKLAVSREIREYVMQQPDSMKLVTGDDEGFMSSASYMLPDRLYKFETVVEDSFVNRGNPDSALDINTTQMPDNVIIVYVKTAGWNKSYMEADFSTFTQFVHEDMTVETETRPWDRMHLLRVVDNFDFKITAPKSAFVITGVYE